jgi:uncharacterized protein YbjT (DUF2867 family)
MIAVDDIGRFVGRVLGDPRRFAGETIELAGDTCTLSEMADVLSGELGRPIEPVHHPADEIEDPAVRTFMQWVNDGGLHADPGALERDYGFAPTTFRDYVAARDWGETAAV